MRVFRRSVVDRFHRSILVPSLLLLAASCTGTNGEPSAADSDSATDGAGGPTPVANSAGHDDAVDNVEDTSWVRPDALAAGQAMLRVLLTDAPIEADNVFVTFCGVKVERIGGVPLASDASGAAGAGGQAADDEAPSTLVVADECQSLDLLTLQGGITEAVGVAALPPGEYGQIRLMLTEASIVVDGVEHELVVPSGTESGLKIAGGFVLHAGTATSLTVDFDAAKSVHYAPGNGYMMRPVIQLVGTTRHDDNEVEKDEERRDEAEKADERRRDETEKDEERRSDEAEKADERRHEKGKKEPKGGDDTENQSEAEDEEEANLETESEEEAEDEGQEEAEDEGQEETEPNPAQ